MANNYRQFSFALQLKNVKEAIWCQKRLKKLSETEDEEGCGTKTDFDWTVYRPTATDPKINPHVWFKDNGESGNVEQIADFVEEYLKKFDKQGYFAMTWADFCDKHRLGEFGGGLALVKADGQHWFQEHQWIDELTKTLTSRNVNS